jgi:hypothetical protein
VLPGRLVVFASAVGRPEMRCNMEGTCKDCTCGREFEKVTLEKMQVLRIIWRNQRLMKNREDGEKRTTETTCADR